LKHFIGVAIASPSQQIPSNKPIEVAIQVQIQGALIGVWRDYER